MILNCNYKKSLAPEYGSWAFLCNFVTKTEFICIYKYQHIHGKMRVDEFYKNDNIDKRSTRRKINNGF